MPERSIEELRAGADGPELAGSLFFAERSEPQPVILMVGGSGPTDRHNDVYFPPIRAGLLDRGLAVASFDKRGVGGSTGRWTDTGPEEQAADVAAEIDALRAHPAVDPARVGIFGHSQGGWVVLEVAARDPRLAFVITNSGPGVSPFRQERYAVECGLRRDDRAPAAVADVLGRFDRLAGLIRDGASLDDLADLAKDPDLARHTLVPTSPDVLLLMRGWLDHEPRPALEAIRVPLLAIFGELDTIVPVDESVEVFRAARAGRPGGLDVAITPGGDHRSQVGDPPILPAAYHETLGDWVMRQLGPRQGRGT
ncbi:MAG: alpha/beta hydrolase [Candidatus Limnocylindrales bacterium]